MKTPAPPPPEMVEVTRVDHLPLVGARLRELAVQDTLDALIPPCGRHVVTVGEGVEALVLTMLTGGQALSRVAATVAGDDLTVMSRRPMDAAPCHDHRLGRALDARWTAGVARGYGAVISQAIRAYALELARRHTDATSLTLDGADTRDEQEEGPVVTYGDRRDHRPDLKPLRCGLTVTAEGVPVWGHSTAGHQRESTEPRCPLTPLRQHLPALGEPLLVADSQFCAGETMALAAVPRLRFVTLVPQSVRLRQALLEAPEFRELPVLWGQPGRRQGEREQYRGASVVQPSRWNTATGEEQEWRLRLLVVESTQLATAKASRRAAAQQAERVLRDRLQAPWQRRPLAGAADARQAATLCRRERRVEQHQLPSTVSADWGPAKRTTRGRPPKAASRPQHQVWRVSWPVHEAIEAIRARAQRESRVVLATNVVTPQDLSDTDLRRASKGQPAAELSWKWAKNPAAIAPIFLERPTRMAALGCGSWLAYRLVERQVRKRLGEGGEPLPDRPAPSQHPTARTVFQLMRTLAGVTRHWAGQAHRHVTTLNAHQLHVIRLLGYDLSISALPPRHSS